MRICHLSTTIKSMFEGARLLLIGGIKITPEAVTTSGVVVDQGLIAL